MPRELKISLAEKTAENFHIFKMEGSLGVEGAAGIQGLTDACLKSNVKAVVLDLKDISFISSAGMGALLAAVGEFRKRGGDMVLAAVPERVRGIFKTLDVWDYFTSADDVAAAVARLRAGDIARGPSLEELTAPRPVGRETAEVTGATVTSLLAAYADILVAEAELSDRLSQIADITANYLTLEDCAFLPLRDELGLAPASAHGLIRQPPAAARAVLAGALAGKGVVAAEQFPGMSKEVAAWFATSHVHFLFPLEANGRVVAALAVTDKKDGTPLGPDERRIVRYLRAGLNLALALHETGRRTPDTSAAAEKQVERKLMELETLFTVAHELAEALEIDKMLPAFLMMLTGQFSTARAMVLLEGDDGKFRVRAARGVDEPLWPKFTLPPHGLASRLDEARAPQPTQVVALLLSDAERGQLTPFVEEGFALLAPLRFKGRLVGIAALARKISGKDFQPDEVKLFNALANLAAVSIETARLIGRFKDTYAGLVRALIAAIEAKDKFTRGHTERVTRYAATLAQELGLDEDTKQALLFGAVLHDVGYIGVPEHILQMPNGITPEQLAELRRHPVIGVKILRDIPFLEKALDAVKYHHERYDGTGYPEGLAGENIPLIARILAVCDAFDAMTSERRFRRAKTVGEAAAEIRRERGKHFDPHIADAFLRLLASGRVGLFKTTEPSAEVDA